VVQLQHLTDQKRGAARCLQERPQRPTEGKDERHATHPERRFFSTPTTSHRPLGPVRKHAVLSWPDDSSRRQPRGVLSGGEPFCRGIGVPLAVSEHS
jgi:hypothetical protein